MIIRPQFRPPLRLVFLAVVLLVLILPHGGLRAQGALPAPLAGEIERAAASIGPLAHDAPPATHAGQQAYALAESRMTAAVVGAISRNPAYHEAIVATAVTAAPAMRDPIVERASRSFPAFAPSFQNAALPPQPEEDENDPGDIIPINDPLEEFNRSIFWFNELLDILIFRPVAWTYGFIMPEFMKERFRKAFKNFNSPTILANDILQLNFENAAITTGRLIVNTTIGLGGMFEVADEMGLPAHHSDLGQTFWHYGIDAGPYLVIPVLGPTTLRDGLGQAGDTFLHPRTYLLDFTTNLAITAANAVVDREALIEPIDDLKANSIDFYSAVRSAWYQNRAVQLQGGVSTFGEAPVTTRADDAFEEFDSDDFDDFGSDDPDSRPPSLSPGAADDTRGQ